jgi:hypothetical protein
VPAPGQPHTGTNAHYRFIFSQHGDTMLRQIDIHASPRFIQTNLD